jgi:cobaltochelatase CobN
MKRLILILAVILLFIPAITFAEQVSFLIIEADSYLVNKAIKELKLPEDISVRFFTHADIMENQEAKDYIHGSKVIIVDVMMRALSDYLIENVGIGKKKVYAVRRSRDDGGLQKEGFKFDHDIYDYFSNLSVVNIQNLICRVVHDELDPAVGFIEVDKSPKVGIYHTDAETTFKNYTEYIKWYQGRKQFNEKAPWIGLTLFASSLIEGQVETVDYVIERLQDEGFNVLPAFGRAQEVLTSLLLDENKKSRVDLILAFSLKFYSSLNEKTDAALADLNVPVINAVNLYSLGIDEWRNDPIGIPPLDVVWNIANPEISGLIEPTPLTGKEKVFDEKTKKCVFITKPIKENIRQLIPRLKMWIKLQRKANREKRVAIFYYNHSQGKQNVGASYLNVFRSLELILQRMQKEGYHVEVDGRISEEEIKASILRYGRNIGSWAPGELDKILEEGKVVRIPVEEYKSWFDKQPKPFKEKVTAQWGHVEESKIMIKNGMLVIPAIRLGNVVIMPEPSRGWGDDPMKLYHDPTVYPHHQYIAAYLYLRYGFDADAMIHLGTHATYEWLPGKQAGLAPADPPEIKMTDIPNIYPYIVDDVGEGIQAKRRGRGVIIDHLTPAFKEGGLYHEYAKLYELISNYNQSLSIGSKTAPEKLKVITDLIFKTGILNDIAKHHEEEHSKASGTEPTHESNPTVTDSFSNLDMDEETLEEIEHYLLEIKENFMPYGLHTFGASPEGEAFDDTIQAIIKYNKREEIGEVEKALHDSGKREIDHLVKALNGRYIPSGEGNDPVRNLAAIPTGKNFYGFNPDRIPSRSAWSLGKKAAQEIIDKHLKEKNKYPEKVAVILWATETIRNEGINESTILYLLGLKPLWDKQDRVSGTDLIPGSMLKRPRIDVLINPSGLYRDLFPNMLLFIDNAIQKASVQTDIENLVRKHSVEMKARLIKQGITEERADLMSKIRIFTEAPGSYGNGVSEMTGNSGFWESDDEIAKVYENRVGFAFGLGKWGEPAKELLKENLKGVDTAVHSKSSNIYGTMDNDDLFAYLGGLSLAIKKESGNSPDTLITMQNKPNQVGVENLEKTIGRELRTRYLNPKWIDGMKKEDYAGAAAMAKFVEYMWGWQVTVPESIDKAKWEQTYDVYVTDKYDLDMKEFFNEASPWAHQSITGRMLEAIRKAYWKADDATQKKLAVDYAVSVVEKGIACCDHTCNNPFLNHMVVNIISLPGVMSPEMIEKFKIAVEQAMGEKMAKQVEARKALQEQLNAGFEKTPAKNKEKPPEAKPEQASKKLSDLKTVEGYKMEEFKDREDESTDLTSSGIQWYASLFILLLIGLFVIGVKRRIN